MSPKRIIIVSTMALAISIGVISKSDEASGNFSARLLHQSDAKIAVKDDFQQALGVSTNEEIYDALYSGKSLADIAADNNMDVQNVIDLQVAELSEQLDVRLASGSLTREQYQSHISELNDIITKSVYGRTNT